MVRRTKGRTKYCTRRERPRERMDSCNLYDLFFGKIGEYGGSGSCKQSLSRSRRAIERNVVSACSGYDKPAFRRLLPPDLVEREVVLYFYRLPQGFSHRRTCVGWFLKYRSGM